MPPEPLTPGDYLDLIARSLIDHEPLALDLARRLELRFGIRALCHPDLTETPESVMPPTTSVISATPAPAGTWPPTPGGDAVACPGCGGRGMAEEELYSFRRRDGEATGRHVSFADRRGSIEFDELEGEGIAPPGRSTRTQLIFRCQTCQERRALTFDLVDGQTLVTFDPVA